MWKENCDLIVDATPLKDSVIFISNSELDGFHEGDGDLMDKLTSSLNVTHGVHAIRIIQSENNVPESKRILFEKKQLVSLSKKDKSLPYESLQKRLLEQVDKPEFSNKKKILYIGSRINIKSGKERHLGESGSLFDLNLIKTLKDKEIKIVVCCLEYKFFRRSLKQIARVSEMLKQQLFLADEIHFLTEPDKEDFYHTIDELIKSPILKPLDVINENFKNKGKHIEENFSVSKRIFEQTNEKLEKLIMEKDKLRALLKTKIDGEMKQETVKKLRRILAQITQLKNQKLQENIKYNNYKLLKDKKDAQLSFLSFERYDSDCLEKQKMKGVFISGIYTVAPLDNEDIFVLAEKYCIEGQKVLDILANRTPNVLHFGMIRGDKGVDEAIKLSEMFAEKQSKSKVIIAGKLMMELGMISNLFRKIFRLSAGAFYDLLNNELLRQGIIKELLGKKAIRQFTDIQCLISPRKQHEVFNQFCTKFYHELQRDCLERNQHIEVYFDVTEAELRKLAMQCRYAIKLDHKGMANNASTMVSCLGLYLPVITTRGLMTNKEFISQELSTPSATTNAEYGKVVIMPSEEYYVDSGNEELRPKNPDIERIYSFLSNEIGDESSTVYRQRLSTLSMLRENKVFDVDEAAGRLIEKVFSPLTRLSTSEIKSEDIADETLTSQEYR